MALLIGTSEANTITDNYLVMAKDGKAVTDIFYDDSFVLEYFLKQKKGLFGKAPGGHGAKVFLEYDGQESGFYVKGETISSTDRESITAVYFDWAHLYGNATVRRIDQLEQTSKYAKVQFFVQRVEGAMKSINISAADSFYDEMGSNVNRFSGVLACCHTSLTLAFGNKTANQIVANDGTKPWTGQRNTTGGRITRAKIRAGRSSAKIRSGKGNKPTLVGTTETLFNDLLDQIELQQQFMSSEKIANAGFEDGLKVDGVDVFPDDYCPSGTMALLNENHMGFKVMEGGHFAKEPWQKIQGLPGDQTMKIYLDAQFVVSNRGAHIVYTGLTTG